VAGAAGFRFCGICTLLLSVAFLLLSALELRRPERQKRTIAAAVLFGAAVVTYVSHTQIVIEPAQ